MSSALSMLTGIEFSKIKDHLNSEEVEDLKKINFILNSAALLNKELDKYKSDINTIFEWENDGEAIKEKVRQLLIKNDVKEPFLDLLVNHSYAYITVKQIRRERKEYNAAIRPKLLTYKTLYLGWSIVSGIIGVSAIIKLGLNIYAFLFLATAVLCFFQFYNLNKIK